MEGRQFWIREISQVVELAAWVQFRDWVLSTVLRTDQEHPSGKSLTVRATQKAMEHLLNSEGPATEESGETKNCELQSYCVKTKKLVGELQLWTQKTMMEIWVAQSVEISDVKTHLVEISAAKQQLVEI
jgi:hypothetical protein